MKKTGKILAVLLVFIMVLSMSACGGSDSGKDLVGTWSLDYDMGDMLKDEMGSDYDEFESSLVMSIRFDFNEDGTFTMYGEKESFTTNFDKWVDEFVAFSVDMMYEMFGDQGYDKEQADTLFQEQYGMGMEDYMRQTFAEQVNVDDLLEEMTTSGKYETSGDKLYLGEEGGEVDKSAWDVFTVTGDTLKLELPAGADASQGDILPGLSYPLEFKKVN